MLDEGWWCVPLGKESQKLSYGPSTEMAVAQNPSTLVNILLV